MGMRQDLNSHPACVAHELNTLVCAVIYFFLVVGWGVRGGEGFAQHVVFLVLKVGSMSQM